MAKPGLNDRDTSMYPVSFASGFLIIGGIKMDIISKGNRFPKDFLWGGSSSAIQFEGALNEDGRGPSVIDNFRLYDDVCDYSIGSDHYNRYKEDVQLMKEAGLKSYRFSFSWSRIFPTGKGVVNEKGVTFYKNLINELVEAGIEPIPTIYHFDYPQGLVDEYGGWIDRKSIDDFVNYSKFLFETFGDKVKYWLTINEQDHVFRIAPRLGLTGKEENFNKLKYQANHNMCVASARVFKLMKDMFPESQIGPALSFVPIYPSTSAAIDVQAANDAFALTVTYLSDLHCFGRYNSRFKKFLEDRDCFPEIWEGDMELMRDNTPDFLAINYYSSYCAKYLPVTSDHYIGEDSGDLLPIKEYGIYEMVCNPDLQRTSFGWPVDPIGLRISLTELYDRYGLPIMITENGFSHEDELINGKVYDDDRIEYLSTHIDQVGLAIESGVEVISYNLWSFIDLTSGREGFKKRYGLVYVNREDFDIKDLKRYKKDSFYWYKNVIRTNGEDL